jgi:hypothetical protein
MRAFQAVILVLGSVSLLILWTRLRQTRHSEARWRAEVADLRAALDRVRTLKGMLAICSSCKRVREDKGHWTQIESYLAAHTAAEFTHSICPHCIDSLYPEVQSPGPAHEIEVRR